jgi:hypothetical protein
LYVELLQTIAEVAATLAGFSGVVFILGRRSEGRLSAKERSGLFHLLFTACSALVLALALAAAVVVADGSQAAWRAASGLLGALCLFGSVRAAVEEVRGEHGLSRVVAWLLPAGGSVLGLACILVALGSFTDLAPAACLACLIWYLVVSVSYFISLLFTADDAA